MLDRIKYQVLAIMLAAGIGAGIGYYTSDKAANKELKKITEEHVKELKVRTERYTQDIDNNLKIIASLQEEVRQNTIKVKTMEDKVKKSDSIIFKRRQDATKLNASEKTNWLLNRYSTK